MKWIWRFWAAVRPVIWRLCGQRSWELRVVIVERDQFGGVCLNRGCIPTKALLRTVELATLVLQGARVWCGWAFGCHTLDLLSAQNRKGRVVKSLRLGVEHLLQKDAITVIKGQGSHRDTLGQMVVRNNGWSCNSTLRRKCL